MSLESGISITHGVALWLSILISGVIAGVLVAVQVAQVPVERTLGARDCVLVMRGFELRYGPRMRVLVLASLLGPIPLYFTASAAGAASLALVVAGHVAAFAVLAVTAVFNLPVNREAVTWDPEHPPVDWEAKRDRWHRGNAIRVPLGLAAFACQAAAAILA